MTPLRVSFIIFLDKMFPDVIEAAEKLSLTHYKLTNMSDTRFVAYWGRCLSNFERDLQISIEVLKIKAESDSKAESR